ncbi:hypothetical protein [Streptomyces sp. NPDC057694]|uniref:hypothetical protein n=1 Tax=Streptomyces sp. NPDC057694 TaxID=3346216 RepID=UPI003688F8C4
MTDEQTDLVLVELIDLVNKTNTSVSLTVLVNGGALSGRLVSNEVWFQSRAELLKGVADGDGVGLHTLYEKWHERFAELNKNAREAGELKVATEYMDAIESVSNPNYLHLVDTVLFGTPKGQGVPFAFRVNIADVSAWSFGATS